MVSMCRNTGSTLEGQVRLRNQRLQGSHRSWWCWEAFGCHPSTQDLLPNRRPACMTLPWATLHNQHNFASRKITSLASTTELLGLRCRYIANQFLSLNLLKLAHLNPKAHRRYDHISKLRPLRNCEESIRHQ